MQASNTASRFAKSSASSLSTGSRASSASLAVSGVVFCFLLAYRLTSYSGMASKKSSCSGISPSTSHRGCRFAHSSFLSMALCTALSIHGSAFFWNSSGLRRRIYSALMARSLRGSKMAGDLEMPSGDQILTSSGREKISCSAYSPRGLQPSRQI